MTLHNQAEPEYHALPDAHRARFRTAFDRLSQDPFRPRPGLDIARLEGVGATPLYRLRVVARRACYAVMVQDREVYILLIAEREEGYAPLLRRALARFRGRRD